MRQVGGEVAQKSCPTNFEKLSKRFDSIFFKEKRCPDFLEILELKKRIKIGL